MYRIDKVQKEENVIRTIGKIISIILYIILIPLIVFNFTLIIKSFINPNKVPDFFGYKSFIIVSGSMEKTIMRGDAIIVKTVSQDEIKVGDIISFDEDGVVVTHRVIDILNENGIKKYRTQGDHNNSPDKQMTTYDKIEGKYQFRIKKFGFITEILKSKITLVVLIIMVILISLYQKNLKQKKQVRKEKRKAFERRN